MHKLIIITILFLLISGCKKTINEAPKSFPDENRLKEMALKAIAGDKSYNDSLSELIDYSKPLFPNFNNLTIKNPDVSLMGVHG